MVSKAFTQGRSLISTILQRMNNIGVVQSKFIMHILILYLSMKSRIHFLNMGRHGNMDEHSYRNQFTNKFNWLRFNVEFVKLTCSKEIIIGFDPSYISKSGKHTHGIGYFYSGCKGRCERGLEIGTFAAIDVNQKTAYHLSAIQSKHDKSNKNGNLIDQYCEMLTEVQKELQELSVVLVVDAYFYKSKYINTALSHNMEVITRLRNDADLKYLYKGPQKKGRGRPKAYEGKINLRRIDKRRIRKCYSEEGIKIYEGEVYCVSLKRNIKLSYVELKDKNDKEIELIFMSTNLERGAEQIYKYYRMRYHMEFNFRDAKQHTGLEECQARDEQKLNFHFNCSLTAVNIAKGMMRKGCDRMQAITYSISDIKTELSNKLLLDLFLSRYGINANLNKNNNIYQELLNFGKRAA